MMFGTLHWNSQTKEADFVKRPHGSVDLDKKSACHRCRARKVKCSANYNSYDGCSRCEHLGKTCNLSSRRHRGDQRRQKASINVGQQEHSLELLIQPSASLSSKETRQGEAVSLLADRSTFDNQQAKKVFTKPPTGLLGNITPSFELSFLAEFGQQNSDLDGDNIFNFSSPLSQLPFFSSSSPSPQPGTIQPATATRSENLLSQFLNSGDETLCYLPSTSQSNGSPFEIDSEATLTSITPISLPASTLFSPAFSSHDCSGQSLLSSADLISRYCLPTTQPLDSSLVNTDSNTTPTSFHGSTLISTASCQCLDAVISAVEEFEASCNSGNRAQLDSIVAYQKEAINCFRCMLTCSACMGKKHNLILLVFITEKIVATCGRVLVLYNMKEGEQDLSTPISSSSSKINCTRSGSIMSTHTDTSSNWQELFLGDYKISSSLEWDHLVRTLIVLQLRSVMELLEDMKKKGSKVLGKTQLVSLAQAKIRIGKLEKDVYII